MPVMATWRPCVVLLLLVLPACGNKRKLDAAADQLLQVITANDYARFRELAHPDLRRHVPPKGLRVLSRAFHQLGGLKDRSMTRIEINSDDLLVGHYQLAFASGSGGMVLSLRDPEVVNLEIGGGALLGALKAVRAQGFGKLGVLSFKWTGAPRAGERLPFQMQIGGLGYDPSGVSVVVSALVLDDLGRVVLDEPRVAQKRQALDRTGPPVALVEGGLALPGGGKYRVDFTIHDIKGRQTHEHSEAIVVEGPPASRPASQPAEALAPDAGKEKPRRKKKR